MASPTLIICVTIGGKIAVSRNGAEMVSPRSMLFRVVMIASSMIALPDVRAVISRPSRIGTPDAMSVDSVRQKRATAIFRSSMPRTGIFSVMASTVWRPPSVL